MGAFSACQLTIIGDAFMIAARLKLRELPLKQDMVAATPNFLLDPTKQPLWLCWSGSIGMERDARINRLVDVREKESWFGTLQLFAGVRGGAV